MKTEGDYSVYRNSGLSLGLGTDVKISKKFTFNIEVLNYRNERNGVLNGVSIGITSKF